MSRILKIIINFCKICISGTAEELVGIVPKLLAKECIPSSANYISTLLFLL